MEVRRGRASSVFGWNWLKREKPCFQNKKPSVFTSTYEEGIKRVLEGNYAFLMESTMLDYNVQRDCNLTQIGGNLFRPKLFFRRRLMNEFYVVSICRRTPEGLLDTKGLLSNNSITCGCQFACINIKQLFSSPLIEKDMGLRLPREASGVTKSRWRSLSCRRRARFRSCTTSGGRTPRRRARATRSRGSRRRTRSAWATSVECSWCCCAGWRSPCSSRSLSSATRPSRTTLMIPWISSTQRTRCAPRWRTSCASRWAARTPITNGKRSRKRYATSAETPTIYFSNPSQIW